MGQLVYFFGGGKAEGSKDAKRILGGKGAGLHEMTSLGIPVPPGFTISAEVCAHAAEHAGAYPFELEAEVDRALGRLEVLVGKRLGDPEDPLLVSVRSGAAASMPGMMDTVLNLGLGDAAVLGLGRVTGDRRFALDAYRRFISMFGSIVAGISRDLFEKKLAEMKAARRAASDAELGEEALADIVSAFKTIYREEKREDFPASPREQLWQAIGAVIRSWQSERAKTYRRIHAIEGLLGTAVNVQTMVFGNRGRKSATGVAFTRNPSTGEDRFFGEFLPNAQGEDVVAGIRTPLPIAELERTLPEAYRELVAVKDRLERHWKDVQDLEFTIEEGRLYLLQTRTAKRTGPAAVRIAASMVREGLIDERTAVLRVEPAQLEQTLFPIFDPQAKSAAQKAGRVIGKGLPAAPGAASGAVVFFSKDAEARAKKGERVILVREETSPEDIGGIVAAQGILTATGGMTSHAAVVGRGMGKCCVVGCGAIHVDYDRREMRASGRTFKEGAPLSIDGATGEVIEGALDTSPSEIVRVLVKKTLAPADAPLYRDFADLLDWADRFRRLKVRANADTPEAAASALALGAEGIGLARTERMFFMPGRVTLMRVFILAEDEEERRRAIERLAPVQREDFVGLFRTMGGRPVTIRLLDPPLHEFLPQEDDQFATVAAEVGLGSESALRAKARELEEWNPMLGRRGCRVGITQPAIYEMQVRAILEAACQVEAEGIAVQPEIMVPLVSTARELEVLRARASSVAEATFARLGRRVSYLFGTMIEIPRAAITADEVAQWADFFSFGTNDLTQCTFGISRDDAGTFLPEYEAQGVFARDPFASLDREGVGRLVQWAIERGRAAKATLKIGICGEHGGDPSSVEFFHSAGLEYVSCSAYRVPIARLAAAHAALAEAGGALQVGH